MQFLDDGPDIPESLIREHLAGNVVFVVGAGLSLNAGFPLFKGLVEDVYASLKLDFPTARRDDHPGEAEACDQGQWDRVLGMLEARLGDLNPVRPHHEGLVRAAVAGRLQSNGQDTSSHQVLLRLSADGHGRPRVVTTNFDLLFERAWPAASTTPLRSVAGAGMPAVGSFEFSGVMHLHGRLPDFDVPIEGSDLILTSGDFGEAYLRSGWAARFVYDLLRRYTVVFIGYSADDPPMRYMLEAAHAGRYRFPDIKSAYAFAGAEPGQEAEAVDKWNGKGLKAVLYRVGTGHDHSALYRTLQAWAACYEDTTIWSSNEIRIRTALSYEASPPDDRNKVKFLVQTMSDAATLSQHALAAGHVDWVRSFLDAHAENNQAMAVPALAQQLAVWFEARAESVDAIRWLLEAKNETLHSIVAETMAWRTRQGNLVPPFDVFWRSFIACTDPPASLKLRAMLGNWSRRDGFSPMGMALAINSVCPRLTLSPPLRFLRPTGAAFRIADICRAELNCRDLGAVPRILAAIPDHGVRKRLFEAADRALVDVCEMARPLAVFDGFGRSYRDPSYVHEPDAIDTREFLGAKMVGHASGWRRRAPDLLDTIFAPITRLLTSCWAGIVENDPILAEGIGKVWLARDFYIFRRMAVWGATVAPDLLATDVERMLSTLRRDEFWGPGLNAEFARYWCSRWSVMSADARNSIESNVLAGREDVVGDAEGIRERAIYRELTRIVSWDGNVLSEHAASERAKIDARIEGLPERLGVTEDLVSELWSGMGRFGDTKLVQDVPSVSLLERVQSIEESDPFNQGELWQKLCEEDPSRAFKALEDAARTGVWPHVRWASFLSFGALSVDPPGPDMVRLLGQIGQMPDDAMNEILPYLTSCMRDIAKQTTSGDVRTRLLALYDRLTGLVALTSAEADDGSDVMFKALNGPAGQIASGLLSLLSESESGNEEVRQRLDALFGLPSRPRLFALAILVRDMTYLFARERLWVSDRLLPAMTAGSSDSARLIGLWAGYSDNFDPLLFSAFREPLERALVSTEIDEESRKALTTVVTRVAFLVLSGDTKVGVTRTDIRRMMTRCRGESLGHAAWLIAN